MITESNNLIMVNNCLPSSINVISIDDDDNDHDHDDDNQLEKSHDFCPICFDVLDNPFDNSTQYNDNIVILKCSHKICSECTIEMIIRNQFKICPLCRDPISISLSSKVISDLSHQYSNDTNHTNDTNDNHINTQIEPVYLPEQPDSPEPNIIAIPVVPEPHRKTCFQEFYDDMNTIEFRLCCCEIFWVGILVFVLYSLMN
jgi:hypothetical protein